MDSRAYVFIYGLQSDADIPLDFPQEIRKRPFDAGVFLPQDDSNWFTRPPKYPARLLLLRGQSLDIVPHPTSGQPQAEVDLRDLLQLETGTALLHGWLRFATADCVYEITYNTRASSSLERFLTKLKRHWLSVFPQREGSEAELYGDQLDIKFRNSLYFELDRDERPILQYFDPPLRSETKMFLFRRERWQAGSLVLLTSLSRLLWITDQYKGRRELYVSRNFSVPFALIRNTLLEDSGRGKHLSIESISGANWRIPLYNAQADCCRFQQRLNEFCGSYARSRARSSCCSL